MLPSYRNQSTDLQTKLIDWFLYEANTCISLVNTSYHCMKSVRIRSYSGPYFPAFGLNTEKYSVYLPIQSECGKIQTKKTPNTDTFSAILITWWYHENGHELLSFNYIMKWALLFAHLRIVKISSRSMLAARPSLPVPYEVLSDFKYCLTLLKRRNLTLMLSDYIRDEEYEYSIFQKHRNKIQLIVENFKSVFF